MASDKDPDVVDATDKHDETEFAEKTLPEDATPNPVADERAESPMQKPTTAPPPPPNGGLLAWSQVAGAFFLYFNTWGLINMFGTYQTFYESGQLFHESSSAISWIGSVQSFLLMFMSIFVGPIYDRGYLRLLLITGLFLIVFGHMMLSLCHEYWQVMLAQGVTIGIGAGMLFIPAVTIGAQYFTTRLGLAMGIATAGSSFGGVLYPIVLFRLIDEVGFPWATRIVGFIALATLLVSMSLLRLRVKPPKIRALLDWTVFRDAHFMIFVLVDLVAYMGIFVFFFYVSYYAQEQHILGATLSLYLVPIFNAASCFGRALPNALADKTGPFNVLAPGVFLAGIFMLLEMTVRHSAAGIIVLAVLTGFTSGVLIGIPPLCFVALTENKAVLGTRMGMGLSTVAFGILAGGPAAGGIIGTRPPLDWTGAWAFGGVCCCVGSLGFWGVRISKYGWKINQKA